MKPVNPHVDIESYTKYLPVDHPMQQEHMLTPTQEFALPILLWLLDGRIHRAEGRSELVAHALIQLAKRGQVVQVEDISRVPHNPTVPDRKRFLEHVLRVAHKHYPRDLFEVRISDFTLIYNGQRAR